MSAEFGAAQIFLAVCQAEIVVYAQTNAQLEC